MFFCARTYMRASTCVCMHEHLQCLFNTAVKMCVFKPWLKGLLLNFPPRFNMFSLFFPEFLSFFSLPSRLDNWERQLSCVLGKDEYRGRLRPVCVISETRTNEEQHDGGRLNRRERMERKEGRVWNWKVEFDKGRVKNGMREERVCLWAKKSQGNVDLLRRNYEFPPFFSRGSRR